MILFSIKHGRRVGRITSEYVKDLKSQKKLYKVTFIETSMYVIYSDKLQELITVLPEKQYELMENSNEPGTSIF
jgi:hypothetical protein